MFLNGKATPKAKLELLLFAHKFLKFADVDSFEDGQFHTLALHLTASKPEKALDAFKQSFTEKVPKISELASKFYESVELDSDESLSLHIFWIPQLHIGIDEFKDAARKTCSLNMYGGSEICKALS